MKAHQSALPVEDPRRIDRVRNRTPAHVLSKIDRRTARAVFNVARRGADAILDRLDAIDREWDIDRYMALNFTLVTAVTEELGRRGSRVFMAIFRAQQVFLGMHALIGWAPPTAVLRRLGIRTQKEIDAERAVLTELFHLLREDGPLEVEPAIVVEEVEVVYDPATDLSASPPVRW